MITKNIEVCKKCNILDDIVNLSMKFDTTISDDGTNFYGDINKDYYLQEPYYENLRFFYWMKILVIWMRKNNLQYIKFRTI